MLLHFGTRLGVYEIVAKLGEGGMGEVYRARDTRLNRDVAIKVLPASFAGDADRLARFEREAQVLASLNHPNIAQIYGVEEASGARALVMELVEGDDLSVLIASGPLPLEDAVPIAKQIADALEAAHDLGIIHRDLKPANIKVRGDGTVKVLDFGLAKALQDPKTSGPQDLVNSPTITSPAMTAAGIILGTPAYMAPEQARGRPVDRRADIWAFGAVFYEMLTGRRAFDGEGVSETLVNVLKADVNWDALPGGTPARVRQVIRVCLQKDVRRRLDSVRDLGLALDGAFDTTDGQEATHSTIGWPPSRALAGALTLSLLTALAVWQALRIPEQPRPVTRLTMSLPATDRLTNLMWSTIALSPDGSRLVYTADRSTEAQGGLYLREMSTPTPTLLPGTGSARSPFFSPDGQWVGFWSDGQLKKVETRGGSSPVPLCTAGEPHGAQWSDDGTIVFSQGRAGIFRVSAQGGTPEKVVSLGENEIGYGPQRLPGSDAVLFSVRNRNWDDGSVFLHSIGSGVRTRLDITGRDARYLPTGHIVYVSGGTLFAVPFDVATLTVKGGAVALEKGVLTSGEWTGAAHFSVSNTGMLVYATAVDPGDRTLVWVDRAGREEALTAAPRAYTYPGIAPDGSTLAVGVDDQGEDIWTWNFARKTLSRLTNAPGRDTNPAWTHDSKRVAFASARDGKINIYWQAADGSGAATRLTDAPNTQRPVAFTTDDSRLLFLDIGREGASGDDVDVAQLFMKDGRTETLVGTAFWENNPAPSPDGKWLAYESDVSGQKEIYLRPFPGVDAGLWPVSRGGGTRPRWSHDGREVFYVAPGGRMIAVALKTGSELEVGEPQELFRGYYAPDRDPGPTYDVSPDGTRFLMIKEQAGASASSLSVVVNWFEELNTRVPVK